MLENNAQMGEILENTRWKFRFSIGWVCTARWVKCDFLIILGDIMYVNMESDAEVSTLPHHADILERVFQYKMKKRTTLGRNDSRSLSSRLTIALKREKMARNRCRSKLTVCMKNDRARVDFVQLSANMSRHTTLHTVNVTMCSLHETFPYCSPIWRNFCLPVTKTTKISISYHHFR